MYDVIIIGAGVTGSSVARELSRYNLKIAVIEKNEDVCTGTSKANSAIVHAGFDAHEGSLMAKLNVEGSEMFPALSKELDFPYEQCGALVVCTDAADKDKLDILYERGIKNGVKNLRIIERKELKEMEPNISDDAVAALFAPTSGIVCPFNLTIALAENAFSNGVEFIFDTEITGIKKSDTGFSLTSHKGDVYETGVVINAAGVYAGVIHNMVSADKMNITPRKGEYLLLDKSAGKHVKRTIFALPSKMGKGVLISPTVHGNLLIGPTASDIEDKEGVNTTAEGLQSVIQNSSLIVRDIPYKSVITSFAGLRACEESYDFIIEEVKDVPGFIDCAGIQSPGLTASPAIGKMVSGIVAKLLHPEKKKDFTETRQGIKKPKSGNIICRCESIYEEEIIDAIRRPLGARSLDGVKRRVRAGMGRCQGGFCSPKVMEIIAKELNIPIEEVTKSGGTSRIIMGKNKEAGL